MITGGYKLRNDRIVWPPLAPSLSKQRPGKPGAASRNVTYTLNEELKEGGTFELISSGNSNPLVMVIHGTKNPLILAKIPNTELIKCRTESWHGPRGDHPVPLTPQPWNSVKTWLQGTFLQPLVGRGVWLLHCVHDFKKTKNRL